jgi:hypothetical protein
MSREEHSLTHGEESTTLNPRLPRSILQLDDARRALVVYLVAMAMIIIGGGYALWRIRLLSDYLAANRAYVLERDAAWQKHIDAQAELSREILRRLPERR